jgi:type IV pilus assembly protein PilX
MKIRPLSQQQGVVLAIALMLLFVMTLIGITALQSSLLQEKITANLNESHLAMQSADNALREAENFIEGLSNTDSFGTSGGLYTQGNAPDPLLASTWTGSSARVSSSHGGQVVAPRYFIELINAYTGAGNDINIYNYGQDPQGRPVTVFRIVARGTGGTGRAEVILESFYGKKF